MYEESAGNLADDIGGIKSSADQVPDQVPAASESRLSAGQAG